MVIRGRKKENDLFWGCKGVWLNFNYSVDFEIGLDS